MQEVKIGDKILFNSNGLPDELELWSVCDGGISYPSMRTIGIDLLNTPQTDAYDKPTGKTLLQHGLEAGYIRLIEKVKADDTTSQQKLAEYLCGIQNAATMDCMKYWRALGENRVTDVEAAKILETLSEIEQRLKYAKNCCHWIINGWEKNDTNRNINN